MKNILKTLLPLLAILALGSCGSLRETVPSTAASLLPEKGQTWQLTAINGRAVPANAKTVTLTFNPEAESFRGTTACNFYAGTYLVGEASLADGRRPFSIALFGSGSILCPEADMNAEERFLALFQKANTLFIDEYTLILFRDNKETLRFGLR